MILTYKVEEVKPNIFAVLVEDGYHLPMLFCRVQEFYESPNDKFRGKDFSIWEYMEWYSKTYGEGSFTYPVDWAGFNIPFPVLKSCFELHFRDRSFETPYDIAMDDILKSLKMRGEEKMYVIGTEKIDDQTFKHEVCHGLFYTNDDYKEKALAFVTSLPQETFETFKTNLLSSGYTESVIEDEIHAYLMFGYQTYSFSKGLDKELVDNLHADIYMILSSYI